VCLRQRENIINAQRKRRQQQLKDIDEMEAKPRRIFS